LPSHQLSDAQMSKFTVLIQSITKEVSESKTSKGLPELTSTSHFSITITGLEEQKPLHMIWRKVKNEEGEEEESFVTPEDPTQQEMVFLCSLLLLLF